MNTIDQLSTPEDVLPERELPGPVASECQALPEHTANGIVEASVSDLPRRERQQRRPINLDSLMWALVLIWVGGLLLAANFGLLDEVTFEAFDLSWNLPFGNKAWTLVFLGAAVLIGIEIVVRTCISAYRRNVLGYVILVIVFASLGLGLAEFMWPMILVAVGVALLLRERRKRRV